MYLNLVQGSVKILLIRFFFLYVYLEQCLFYYKRSQAAQNAWLVLF